MRRNTSFEYLKHICQNFYDSYLIQMPPIFKKIKDKMRLFTSFSIFSLFDLIWKFFEA